MLKYMINRIFHLVPVLFMVSVMAFLMVRFLPGDVLDILAGEEDADDPEVRAAFIEEYGLDKPIYVQYARWVGRVLHGDFGDSMVTRRPIAVELFEDLRRSRDVIGETRNAWMMHTGEVKASEPVADWMRRALSLELEDGNFGVTGSGNTGSPPLALYGEVDVVASSKRKSTDAVVQFTVKLKRGFKILFTRAYRGVATLTPEARRLLETELGDSVDPFGEALAQALSNAAAPLASDLRAALRREAGIDN